jgi:hypothetical protein
MRQRYLGVLVPLGVSIATACVVACSGGDKSEDLVVTPSTNEAAVVITSFTGDSANKESDVCTGTLIAPNLVVTAGHCATGKTGWKVQAPLAKGEKSTGLRGMTFDWRDYGSTKSHPTNSDIGVIELESPIDLKEFPKITSTTVDNGTRLTRLRRTMDTSGSYTKSRIDEVSGKVHDGEILGFGRTYIMATESDEAVNAGGALVDPTGKTIYGVVSGRGEKSGSLYMARADMADVNAWLVAQVRAHKKSGAMGASINDALPPSLCWGNCAGTPTSNGYMPIGGRNALLATSSDKELQGCLPGGALKGPKGTTPPATPPATGGGFPSFPGFPGFPGSGTNTPNDGGTSTPSDGGNNGTPGNGSGTGTGNNPPSNGGSNTTGTTTGTTPPPSLPPVSSGTNNGGNNGPGGSSGSNNGGNNGPGGSDGSNSGGTNGPGGSSGSNSGGSNGPGSVGAGNGTKLGGPDSSDCEGKQCGGCDSKVSSCIDNNIDYGSPTGGGSSQGPSR